MLPTGVFVPEGGSRVTSFSDYCFGPDALPIWNLPGYFKKVDKSADRKDPSKKLIATPPETR
jgi:hypothetical protein